MSRMKKEITFVNMENSTNKKSLFFSLFKQSFGFTPVEGQAEVMEKLVEFLFSENQRNLLVLTGYAGTGKTSLMGAFVQTLKGIKHKSVLLAPTGRAAKVLSSRSKQMAFTIHKRIYRKDTVDGGGIRLNLAPNLAKNTLFILDEASMLGDFSLSDDGSVIGRNLLEDVINFVYSGENCKLIFIGDEGQLPPVGSDFSPALNQPYLENHYPTIDFEFIRLRTVLRQAADSDILMNATALRNAPEGSYPAFEITGKGDLIRLSGTDLQDALESAYSNFGTDESIVITRSNKRANQYNQQIRNRILWFEDELCGGDLLMVVKNNYYWLADQSNAGFIANGEIVKVNRILGRETRFGFQFARARVQLIDYEEMGDFEAILWMDALSIEKPAMPREAMKTLFFELEKDYLHEQNKRKRYELIMKDPYMNALQVKFAYAITCHKSQGGQWATVFLDHGYLTDEMLDTSFFRWLYTGFTRASFRLYLLNFDAHFFPGEEE